VKLGVVILAAGAGSRLGGVAKALLEVDGVPFLDQITNTACELGFVDAVVVVGSPFGEAVAARATALGLRVVVNPDPARGMASSVALGFAALGVGEAEAAWLWPVDHPHVMAATLRALASALGTHEVAQPRLGERGGHPPLIARAAWPRFAACANLDGGARTVLATADVIAVAVDDPGVVRDIDTPADAKALA
jgi:CTP:molybdopterin cytidylyltransferase MocA